MWPTVRYAPGMELETIVNFALAVWPFWLGLGVVIVVRWCLNGADTYEEPPAAPDFTSEAARKYHGDDSVGR
jgi:hypothetical protein